MKYPGQIEWFPIVDEDGNTIGKAPRHVCHDGKSMLLHPVVHLHVFNSIGELFLQKRSMSKDVQPGKWDTSVGGHVSPGEEIIDAVKREASEELGLENPDVVFEGRYIWQSQIERELVNVFTTTSDLIPSINRVEIEEGKFWTIEEITDNIGKGVFTPNFEHEFRMHAGGNESFAGKFSRRAFRKK